MASSIPVGCGLREGVVWFKNLPLLYDKLIATPLPYPSTLCAVIKGGSTDDHNKDHIKSVPNIQVQEVEKIKKRVRKLSSSSLIKHLYPSINVLLSSPKDVYILKIEIPPSPSPIPPTSTSSSGMYIDGKYVLKSHDSQLIDPPSSDSNLSISRSKGMPIYGSIALSVWEYIDNKKEERVLAAVKTSSGLIYIFNVISLLDSSNDSEYSLVQNVVDGNSQISLESQIFDKLDPKSNPNLHLCELHGLCGDGGNVEWRKYLPSPKVIGCSEEGDVCVWDIPTDMTLFPEQLMCSYRLNNAHQGPVNDVGWCGVQSERFFVSVGHDGFVKFWDIPCQSDEYCSTNNPSQPLLDTLPGQLIQHQHESHTTKTTTVSDDILNQTNGGCPNPHPTLYRITRGTTVKEGKPISYIDIDESVIESEMNDPLNQLSSPNIMTYTKQPPPPPLQYSSSSSDPPLLPTNLSPQRPTETSYSSNNTNISSSTFVPSPSCRQVFRLQDVPITAVSFCHGSNRMFVTGSWDGNIYLWDINDLHSSNINDDISIRQKKNKKYPMSQLKKAHLQYVPTTICEWHMGPILKLGPHPQLPSHFFTVGSDQSVGIWDFNRSSEAGSSKSELLDGPLELVTVHAGHKPFAFPPSSASHETSLSSSLSSLSLSRLSSGCVTDCNWVIPTDRISLATLVCVSCDSHNLLQIWGVAGSLLVSDSDVIPLELEER